MQDINPYTEMTKEKAEERSALEARMDELKRQLERVRTFDRGKLAGETKELKDQIRDFETKISKNKSTQALIKQESFSERVAVTASMFAKGVVFPYTRVKREIKNDIKKYEQKIRNARAIIQELEQKQYEIDSIDLESSYQELQDLRGHIASVEEDLNILENKREALDESLGSIPSRLVEINNELQSLDHLLKEAHQLQDKIDNAANSYERREVHKSCENKFGIGSPGKAIKYLNGRISKLGREERKLKERADELVKRVGMKVKNLIIDGNNLCYSNGSQWIGLSVLKKITSELKNKYSLTIIFDASIRRLLSASDSQICEAFDSGVEVHVVATQGKADETILKYAGTDPHTFVVSNDRFNDFEDEAVIFNNRVIRHEVVGSQVFIHELGYSAQYE